MKDFHYAPLTPDVARSVSNDLPSCPLFFLTSSIFLLISFFPTQSLSIIFNNIFNNRTLSPLVSWIHWERESPIKTIINLFRIGSGYRSFFSNIVETWQRTNYPIPGLLSLKLSYTLVLAFWQNVFPHSYWFWKKTEQKKEKEIKRIKLSHRLGGREGVQTRTGNKHWDI